MKKTLFFILLGALIILNTDNAIAEEKGLAIYPPIIKIKAQAPTNIKVPIKVKNLTDTTQEAEILIKPFRMGKDERLELILQKDYTPEVSKFLSSIRPTEDDQNISKTIFSPQQQKSISLSIDIPKDFTTQDYYFSVIFVTSDTSLPQSSHSKQQIGIGTNILLSVGKSSGFLTSSFSSPFFTNEGALKFTAGVKNESDHFATINPQVDIKNIFGNTIETIDIGEHNVLAKSSISFDQKKLTSRNKYFFGPYKTEFLVNGGLTKDKVQYILVLPGKSVLIFTAILIFFAGLSIRIRARLKKNNLK